MILITKSRLRSFGKQIGFGELWLGCDAQSRMLPFRNTKTVGWDKIRGTCASLLHTSLGPHPACPDGEQGSMAKVENENRHDPIQLAWMVKEVAWPNRGLGLAGQPDSPSRQAGWGLGSVAFVASWTTFFTIRANRMGSL
jgi:hypothetical protein